MTSCTTPSAPLAVNEAPTCDWVRAPAEVPYSTVEASAIASEFQATTMPVAGCSGGKVMRTQRGAAKAVAEASRIAAEQSQPNRKDIERGMGNLRPVVRRP